ncbi:hypothetical protein GCM10022221_54200 [Actinocorallia aurea]
MGEAFGGWAGFQAEYSLVPYADFNLYVFPDADQARERLLDVAMIGDILPTGYHAARSAGVGPGSTVYVAGAGPVGLASAAACRLLGAAAVVVPGGYPAGASMRARPLKHRNGGRHRDR